MEGPQQLFSSGSLAENYKELEVIGHGNFGTAVLVERKADGQLLVVKQIKLSELAPREREDALQEARMLSGFNHANIIQYHESILEEGLLHIVMEYADDGDLCTAVQQRSAAKNPMSEAEIMFWFVQILLALWHVHSKNVLHRDLKTQNIFLAKGNILKLGDFGIARVLTSGTDMARTVIGTPYYLSPEICEDKPYDQKSDCWSLGCVLYEMCTLKRAFDGQSLPALVVKILRGKYPPLAERYSVQLRSLVDSMLRQKPKDRPSVEEMLRQPYVLHHVKRYLDYMMRYAAASGLSPVLGATQLLDPCGTGLTVRRSRSRSEDSEADAERAAVRPPVSSPMMLRRRQADAELERQREAVLQERERRKALAAQRANAGAASLGRRAAARQSAAERHRQEAEAMVAERARIAAAVAQRHQEREAEKARQQEEARRRLASHKEGVKAVKPRIDRTVLKDFGAAFAARALSSDLLPAAASSTTAASHSSEANGSHASTSASTAKPQRRVSSDGEVQVLFLAPADEHVAGQAASPHVGPPGRCPTAGYSADSDRDRRTSGDQASTSRPPLGRTPSQIRASLEQRRSSWRRSGRVSPTSPSGAAHASGKPPAGSNQHGHEQNSSHGRAAASASTSGSSTPAAEGRHIREWIRQRKSDIHADPVGFPEMQLFCPPGTSHHAAGPNVPSDHRQPDGGSYAEPSSPANGRHVSERDLGLGSALGTTLGSAEAEQDMGTAEGISQRLQDMQLQDHSVRAAWDELGGRPLLEVLTDIQDALGKQSQLVIGLDSTPPVPTRQGVPYESARADGQSVQQASYGHASTAAAEGHENGLQGGLVERGSLASSESSSDQSSGGTSACGGADALTATRLEQLRFSLEQQLGADKLLAAYRYLKSIQAAEGEHSTQETLEIILGPQMHLARHINRLLLMEDAVYG